MYFIFLTIRNLKIKFEKKTSIIQKNIISFLYFLFDEINNMEILLSKLKISAELKAFKTNDIKPQEKLNEFMNSQKGLMKFKNLFDFQRIERLKQFLNSRKFASKTDFSSILKNISEILLSLYGPFDNIIVNNRQAFFAIYYLQKNISSLKINFMRKDFLICLLIIYPIESINGNMEKKFGISKKMR